MQYCSIVPKEVVEKYGTDFRSHPCGTGPFQFVAWEEGQALIFKKNENYFEKDSAGNRFLISMALKLLLMKVKQQSFYYSGKSNLIF